jgi:hypothetical protein
MYSDLPPMSKRFLTAQAAPRFWISAYIQSDNCNSCPENSTIKRKQMVADSIRHTLASAAQG